MVLLDTFFFQKQLTDVIWKNGPCKNCFWNKNLRIANLSGLGKLAVQNRPYNFLAKYTSANIRKWVFAWNKTWRNYVTELQVCMEFMWTFRMILAWQTDTTRNTVNESTEMKNSFRTNIRFFLFKTESKKGNIGDILEIIG